VTEYAAIAAECASPQSVSQHKGRDTTIFILIKVERMTNRGCSAQHGKIIRCDALGLDRCRVRAGSERHLLPPIPRESHGGRALNEIEIARIVGRTFDDKHA